MIFPCRQARRWELRSTPSTTRSVIILIRSPFKLTLWIVDPSGSVSEDDVALSQSALCPFGIGPRNCAGKALAYTEMSIILARIVFLFDFRLSRNSPPGEGRPIWAEERKRKDDFHIFDSILALHDGPMVEFKWRT